MSVTYFIQHDGASQDDEVMCTLVQHHGHSYIQDAELSDHEQIQVILPGHRIGYIYSYCPS
jgi:hypothetical protein